MASRTICSAEVTSSIAWSTLCTYHEVVSLSGTYISIMGQQAAPYPYAVSEEPRELSEQDLAFLSAYTGQKDMQKLQEHVVSVWRTVKAQSWVYCCIQVRGGCLCQHVAVHAHA